MNAYKSWWKPRDASDGEDEPHNAGPAASFDPKPMQPPQDAPGEQLPTRRIHLLGLGSIGLLIAHSLKVLPNPPPVTLMMHRNEAYANWARQGRLIRLEDKASGVIDEQFDYDTEIKQPAGDGSFYWKYVPATKDARPGPPLFPLEQSEKLESGEVYIHCLIVTVKAQITVEALRSVAHRINASSTICLMQNGLGQIDELNTHVFTDPSTRPTYLIGVISHGCYTDGAFKVVHAGLGVTSLGIYRDTHPTKHPLPPPSIASQAPSSLSEADRRKYYPTDEELYTASLSARFLLRTLTRSTILMCAAYPYLDLLMLQLEKLSSNALLNPLTTLFDVPNGAMLESRSLNVIQNMLVSETSLVFRSLPELQPLPNIRHRFSPDRLKALFVNVAHKTAANSSSMREDLRLHRPNTEIDYINGYVVKRGEELGIRCACHFMVLQMIKAKNALDQSATQDVIPYGTSVVQGKVDVRKVGREEEGVVIEDVGSRRQGRGRSS